MNPISMDKKHLKGLNKAQLTAVAHRDGPLLVLAGAGSGKTRVITCRAAHLINSGVPADRICVLSFTNKAAREVAARVRELVGEKSKGIAVSTFHSLGLSILRGEGKRIGLGRDMTLIGEGERRTLVRQIVQESAPSLDPTSVGDAISSWKNRGMTVEEAARGDKSDLKVLLELYSLYEATMKAQRSVDFDDLLLKPLKLLQLFDDARFGWSSRFDYIMVDEYQDTNRVQFELLGNLAAPEFNLCVVGDDDQAIYGWRGAEVELILNFPRHFEGVKTVVLDRNYRSTANILDSAHAVVIGLKDRHSKKLRTDKEAGAPIVMVELDDENEEAGHVASAIMSERYRTNRPWSHFAVLYRTNAQSRAFEQAFRSQEIPHIVIGGSRFFDRKEVRDVISYLRVIAHPRDDTSLMRIANVPKRGLGRQSLLALQQRAEASSIPLYRALEEAEELPPAGRAGANALLSLIRSFRDRFNSEGLTAEGLEDFIDKAKLRAEVRSSYESKRAVERRLELFDELILSVETLTRGARKLDVATFIDIITLDPPADKEEEDTEAVHIMTLHSAKGLEFPVVYLCGMEEGLLPHNPDGPDASRGEEERRLCYVGITRAMEQLTLCHARVRSRRGTAKKTMPSRYLAEVPVEVTEQGCDDAAASKEEVQEMAQNFFKGIKDMLD